MWHNGENGQRSLTMWSRFVSKIQRHDWDHFLVFVTKVYNLMCTRFGFKIHVRSHWLVSKFFIGYHRAQTNVRTNGTQNFIA